MVFVHINFLKNNNLGNQLVSDHDSPMLASFLSLLLLRPT